ncbi:hypothetical protein XENOCAPTIV_004449 [Xenoophorus captivus]|uniref:Uncharacterized protein n=1 Tax=Xenoophorus captivus TaxID=1517983 RepID=A0ABV0QPV9_9TELE
MFRCQEATTTEPGVRVTMTRVNRHSPCPSPPTAAPPCPAAGLRYSATAGSRLGPRKRTAAVLTHGTPRHAEVLFRFWGFSFSQLTVELLSEGIKQVRDGFLHADVSLQLSAQRSHAFAFNPTRYDVAEPRQNILYTKTTNFTDLSLLRSDLLEAPQVQNRVTDQLPRSMEGDESSSVGAVDVGPQQAKLVQKGTRVWFVPDPSGVDRRVLTQQKCMGWSGPVPVHIDLLQPQTLLIGDQAQTDHLHQGPDSHPELQ